MTEFPTFEDIETFCPASKRQAKLQLRTVKKTPAMILGVPYSCNHEAEACRQQPGCMMKAQQILTRRNKQ